MKGGQQRDHIGDLVLWWEDGRAEVLSSFPLAKPEEGQVIQHEDTALSRTLKESHPLPGTTTMPVLSSSSMQ